MSSFVPSFGLVISVGTGVVAEMELAERKAPCVGTVSFVWEDGSIWQRWAAEKATVPQEAPAECIPTHKKSYCAQPAKAK